MTGEAERAANLQAIGVLTRSTVHDLNNFMMAITTFAELVLADMGETHPLRGQVAGILGAGRRAIETTHELQHIVRGLAPIGVP